MLADHLPKGRAVKRISFVAAVVAALVVGTGAGAVAYSALAPTKTRTEVQPVTVSSSQPAAATTGGLSVSEIYRRARAAVVEITVTSSGGSSSPFGDSGTQKAQGSGFVYDANGDIVTAQHVVDGASSISVKFANGATYSARLVGSDASTDLAVVHVDAPASLLSPLALADSSKAGVGDAVVAIGSPFGLEETVTTGIVSALHRTMTSPNGFSIEDSIQTDAAINHGNSGGPLLDAGGRVLGVTTQIESDSGGSDGVGFAVPSNTVRSVVAQLLSNGQAVHAYLGVAVQTPSSGGGAEVTNVRTGTPASDAGLRSGDVITSVDGTKVGSSDDVIAAVSAHKPGDSISITYRRNGQSHTVKVPLGTRPT
jgi:putative serine protease PepD